MALTKLITDLIEGDFGGGTTWVSDPKTADFTAVAGEGYFVNTTSTAITVTLPSSPSAGDEVSLVDYGANASTNNITITSSDNIEGASDDLVLSTDKVSKTLVYSDATKGWLVTTEAGAGGTAATPGLNDSDFFSDGNDVLLMRFENNLTDDSGTVIPTGSGVTYTASGKFSNAVVGNSSTPTEIDLGLNVSTFSGITISVWVYWESTLDAKVFSGKTSGVTNRQNFSVDYGNSRVRYTAENQNLYEVQSVSLSTGWHHFAVTDDYSGNHTIYIDGQSQTSTFIVSSSYTANTSATIFYGMRNTGSTSGSHTDGKIDQLRVFSTAYSSNQIQSLANES